MPNFTVVDLDEGGIDAAYPLVRTLTPEVSPAQWRDYACKARDKGGLLGLVADSGTLFGLLSYRIEESLQDGPVLSIRDFVTFELSGAAPGRRALCEAAEAVARKKGCTSVELRLASRGFADGGTAKAQGWTRLGHNLDAVVFAKHLDSGAPTAAP